MSKGDGLTNSVRQSEEDGNLILSVVSDNSRVHKSGSDLDIVDERTQRSNGGRLIPWTVKGVDTLG